jgi:hypothetical protein
MLIVSSKAVKCCGKTLLWLKLSNSGDSLKLMIPSYSRKAVSGQNNYLGMVTSYKMMETEMGYRGSKSKFLLKNNDFVKEQRVDGSWSIKAITKKMLLRCTLMDFERNYQVKIPSNQLNKSFFSTAVSAYSQDAAENDTTTLNSINKKLNPYFVSGFADAESCFSTTIYKNNKLTTGYRVRSCFEISLNQRDGFLISQIQLFFEGIGTRRFDKKSNAVKYSVDSLKDLTNIIIPHFKKYQLISQKKADFLLFEKIIELMNNGKHTALSGLQQIINIKASMNLGISEIIKSEFKDINPVKREIIKTTIIPDPNWVAGFVSGEGNFDAGIRKPENTSKGLRSRVYLRFRLAQHARDTHLLNLIIKYLGTGRLEIDSRKPLVLLVVGNISEISKIIIPFFKKYPILGTKYLDYQDWCKIASIITNGAHLTKEGLESIRPIKSGMNRGRKKR